MASASFEARRFMSQHYTAAINYRDILKIDRGHPAFLSRAHLPIKAASIASGISTQALPRTADTGDLSLFIRGAGIQGFLLLISKLELDDPKIGVASGVRLRIAPTGAVLGGARCGNQGGIDHSAGHKQQAVRGQFGVDDLQNLQAQIVLFKQMAKAQDANLVGNSLGAADPYEVSEEACLEQGLLVISDSKSGQGMTCSISSSKICLRARRVIRSKPRSFCFIPSLPAIYGAPVKSCAGEF